MIKKVLYIDDQPDKRVLDVLQGDLEDAVNDYYASNSFKVIVTPEIPNNYINLEEEVVNYNSFFDHLDKKHLQDPLDLVMCDFNMHEDHKHIAFHIIAHIRSRNKACGIILFSGSPLKELMRMNNGDLAKSISHHIKEDNPEADISVLSDKLEEIRKSETPAEDLLDKAVTSGISDIVSRKHHEERAIIRITQPSLLQIIEHELLLHGETIFNDGHESLNGLPLKEVAKKIRMQSEEGKYFTELMLQLSLGNLIDMNTDYE